ncbi:hypothetical protein [Natronorarus salvus]|uniref:hypothetical protein n=1 Tax=Natronorarus salvus TaxID=3117733 RepID=UPI002F26A219
MARSGNSTTGPGWSAAPIKSAFFLLALTLAGIHLYLGLLAPFVPSQSAVQFVVIAIALLVGPLVSLTSYWRPVLYLLGSALAVYLGVIWLLAGMEYFAIGVLTGVVATAFVVLGVYLFVRESTATTEA